MKRSVLLSGAVIVSYQKCTCGWLVRALINWPKYKLVQWPTSYVMWVRHPLVCELNVHIDFWFVIPILPFQF